MDYANLVEICRLYDLELELLDESANDVNSREKYEALLKCHQQIEKMLGKRELAKVYEEVRGLANPVTIDLYFEEAEKLEDNYEKMIPIYQHALEGCQLLYGNTGEKTIECKLQIVVCMRALLEKNECEDCHFSHEKVLELLEELFLQRHGHPLYGTFISTLLCDEYVQCRKKQRAIETFEKWSEEHSVENISDIEEFNAWIEYTALLAELGHFKIAENNINLFRKWMEEKLEEFDAQIPYMSRRISEIYVSCALYKEAIEILENINKHEMKYPVECEKEFLNVNMQLALCYNLDGKRVEAINIAFALQEKVVGNPIFENIMSNIMGGLEDHFEQYGKLMNTYTESKRRLGDNHEETILYEMNLGNACFEMYYQSEDSNEKKKYLTDAEDYLTDAYEHSEFGMGKGNLFSLRIKQSLAEVKAEKGEVFEALYLLEEVWKKSAEVLTEDNPEVADAKLRYAALCLEIQEHLEEIPEWIAELDVEPLLKQAFESKEKYLGIGHWETLDALYWYTYAVQSNELINYLQGNTKDKIFDKSIGLHQTLLMNLEEMLEQAFYINSVEKQNEYMNILEREFFQMFRLLINSQELNEPVDLERFYEMIGWYKNLSYDMQSLKFSKANNEMREKIANTMSIDMSVLQYLYKNGKYTLDKDNRDKTLVGLLVDSFTDTKKAFVDIWQEANMWNIFIIDSDGINYRSVEHVNDEEILTIEEAEEGNQLQLDDLEYSLEERMELAELIVEDLAGDLKKYSEIYCNFQKQLNQLPITAFIYELVGVPSVIVSSVHHIIDSNEDYQMNSLRVGVVQEKESIDYQIISKVIEGTSSIENVSGAFNIIAVSGHGIYDTGVVAEGVQNYIELGNCQRIYVRDIISKDLSNIELAFLPICQSGTGTNYQNFGEYSIGKAFRISGAGYTIEVLWDIPLSASLVFEYEFFKYLKDTMSVQDAFYLAMHRLKNYEIEDVRKFCEFLLDVSGDRQLVRIIFSEIENELCPFEAPFYWAGFCLQKGVK